MHQPKLKLTYLTVMLFTFSSYGDSTIFSNGFERIPTTVEIGESSTFGSVTSTSAKFTYDATTACDRNSSARTLAINYQEKAPVPNAIYTASCTTDAGVNKLFTSLTVRKNGAEKGMIIESILKNGKVVPTGVTRDFPECKEMHGIAANKNCSVVGALCRNDNRIKGNEDFKRDLIAKDLPKQWDKLYNQRVEADDTPEMIASKNLLDTEWIYEWSDGNIAALPDKYVLHKGIGSWEYGRQDLVFADELNSYGAYLKTALVSSADKKTHESDTMMIIDRKKDGLHYHTKRGWKMSCAAGHTVFNHAAFNPNTKVINKFGREYTGVFAGFCGTDSGAVAPYNNGHFGGLWLSIDVPMHFNGIETGFLSIPRNKNAFAGGVSGGILPMQDGSFLGAITGVNEKTKGALKGDYKDNHNDWQHNGPTTSIGIVHMKQGKPDTAGRRGWFGNTSWLVEDKDWFYTSPQLASLGNGKYLLGYAKTAKLSDKDKLKHYNQALTLPSAFYVVEIDANGKKLSEVQEVKHGWGDQDRMVALGDGKVAWTYIPDPAYKTATEGDNAKQPSCEVGELSFNVYQSK